MLCPAYRRLDGHPDDVRESSFPHVYLPRHQQILRLHELWSSDIVCCQEFWYASQDLFNLYVRTLQSKYRMHGVQRPARDGSKRPDGLFMCISREWQVLHEADIDFADAAGRCAQVLHLRRSSGDRPMEVIVANVHLLFPHNAASGRIRVREAHKLLEYIDVYKRSLERPPPTVVCGDLNGDRVSVVRRHFSRLGWECTLERARPELTGNWVSHNTHIGEALGVDYVLLQNPSQLRPSVVPWTDMVFSEIAAELLKKGFTNPADAWDLFERFTGVRGSVDSGVLMAALRELGFGTGSTMATLTQKEVDYLVSSCDVDGSGDIDSCEWDVRFRRALERLNSVDCFQDVPYSDDDLVVRSATLYPSCLEIGRWPDDEEWDLSDHGIVTTVLERRP